jgi:GGDEF domain-containing protein
MCAWMVSWHASRNMAVMTMLSSISVPQYDPICGLWNAAGFAYLCGVELARGTRASQPAGLVVTIELAPLSVVEARLGAGLSAAALSQVVAYLRAQMRGYDVLGLVGVDELALLWPRAVPDAATLDRVQRLNQDINRLCLNWQGQTVFQSAAVSVQPLGRAGTGRGPGADLYYKQDLERNLLS